MGLRIVLCHQGRSNFRGDREDREVPDRLIIAYALIGVIIVALMVGSVLIRRQHIRRKQDIRGNRGYR
jgi:hypothetical protein